MATRTQKAAMKKKAEAAKAKAAKDAVAKADKHAPEPVAKPAKAAKSPAPKTGKASKSAPSKPEAKAKPAKTKSGKSEKSARSSSSGPEELPEPERVPFMERFWHRVSNRAQKKEAAAHRHEAELEQAERVAAREAAERARQEKREEAAVERRKATAAAREMKRIAEEEDARLKREARETKEREKAEARKIRALERASRRTAVAIPLEAPDAEPEPEAEPVAIPSKPKWSPAAPDPVVAFREAPAASVVQDAEEADDASDEGPEVEVPPPEPKPASKSKPLAEPAPAPAKAPAPKVAPAPVAPKVVPPPASPAEEQADRFAAEMAARRSKPIQIEDDEVHDLIPKIPVGRHGTQRDDATPKEVLQIDPAPPARIDTAPRGLSVPEQYLLLTLEDGWDERRERIGPGSLGGALVGSLVLDLILQGKVRVQRDRFQVTDVSVDDAGHAVSAKLAQWTDLPSLQALKELGKWLPQLLPAYKDRMAARGLLEHRSWRHLGLFYRSQTALLDVDAQERLRNKLGRAIAGGGRPDAPTILALGLLEVSGLFGLVVPEGAQPYNRKRLNGLLAGKDVMGYKVDDELKGMQEIAVRTVLDNVRILTQG